MINERENISPIFTKAKLIEDIKDEEKEKIESLNTSNLSDEFFSKKKNFISKDILGPIHLNHHNNTNNLNPKIPNYYFNPNNVNNNYNPTLNIDFCNNIPPFDVNVNYHNNYQNINSSVRNPILPFKVNNIFNPSPRDAMKITNMYKLQQQNSQTPLRSIYDNYVPNNVNYFNFCENQSKEFFEVNIHPPTCVINQGCINSNTNGISFDDFNKFNTSKVESSELNSRKLKTTKIIKNPN